MKIIVTGCSGFVGKNIVKYLNEKNYKVYCINSDIDICNKYEIKEVIEDIVPDAIVHLAAKSVPGVEKNKWDELWKTNVDGTKNILDCAPSCCKFINFSSITIYGSDFCEESATFNPTTIYAASKIASESLVCSYTNLGLIKGINLRFCAIVGEGLTHGVLKDFIYKLKKHEKLTILGDKPGSIKPYLHVRDVCSAVELALNSNITHKGLIISSNNSISINTIAEICMETLDINKEKVWLGEEVNFRGDNKEVVADNSEAKRYLKWKPSYNTSEEAIIQAIKENI